jgi:hypothetical protein
VRIGENATAVAVPADLLEVKGCAVARGGVVGHADGERTWHFVLGSPAVRAECACMLTFLVISAGFGFIAGAVLSGFADGINRFDDK